ncbi:hypothetical protein CFOL_v3_34920 [Cephalotus follicularis]|uniref:Uncharacterized protein n=1 Tax=Cephalotus follicularis TaxID=3775 RepID=A0A1Q3DG69_CEPFO|nr:hypothetical protein CFOL_v3_34920 [Cephalotus follicularis]
MNPHKTEDDLFHHHHDLVGPPPPHMISNHQTQSQPSISNDPTFLPEIVLFRSSSSDSPSNSSSENDDVIVTQPNNNNLSNDPSTNPSYISPDPHISTQFYTFNAESHSLMIRCILEQRLASPAEIRAATPEPVLRSWRAVWKDRNEDTAYLTAWKRIQDKLTAHVDPTNGSASLRSKRRRFEYTESFDVPAKEVPNRLQQLAAKHKVVLCIRQKYIRYKPFMAEVKDYACHRAGEPTAKKSRILKREPYASKRCGCGFRIRAIVPIANYNEKNKTFVYKEDGMAVFKLYAVHSGHEPGPLDGNARIMHRVVGHKGGSMTDQEIVYGVREDMEYESFGFMGKDEGDLQLSVLQQLQELRHEIGLLEGRIEKIPCELLGSVSRDLFDIVNKIRSIGEDGSKPMGLLCHKQHPDGVLLVENDLAHWSDHHHERIYGDGKEVELIEDDEDSFGRTLGDVVPWEQIRTECRTEKDLISDPCKPDKWLKCSDFDEKSILDCEDTKLTKSMSHDETIVADVGLIQVDSFYQENPKWYDSPCGLDNSADCGDSGFRHGEIA